MFLTCKSFKIVHTWRKKNSSRLETVIALSQYTSPRYFAVKYSRYRGGGMAHLFTVTLYSLKYYFETSTLNVSRLNHGDFLPALFCVLLRRFPSRISNNIRASF